MAKPNLPNNDFLGKPLSAWLSLNRSAAVDWDMTAAIDVVFLLMIFFMLVCQFVGIQLQEAALPAVAQSAPSAPVDGAPMTITIQLDPATQKAVYTVFRQRLPELSAEDLRTVLTAAINERVQKADNAEQFCIRLRCDGAVSFGSVQPILQAIAASAAVRVEWSVYRANGQSP